MADKNKDTKVKEEKTTRPSIDENGAEIIYADEVTDVAKDAAEKEEE